MEENKSGEVLFIVMKPYKLKRPKAKGFSWVIFPNNPLQFFKGFAKFDDAFKEAKGRAIREMIVD